MSSLNAKAWFGVTALAVVMGLVLFVPSGTIGYWQAWVYMGIFMGASCLMTIYLMRHDRALLQRRLRGGPTAEKRAAQRFIMFLASAGFIATLVVPALDRRFMWSSVPVYAVVAGDVLVAASFCIMFRVLCTNNESFTAWVGRPIRRAKNRCVQPRACSSTRIACVRR